MAAFVTAPSYEIANFSEYRQFRQVYDDTLQGKIILHKDFLNVQLEIYPADLRKIEIDPRQFLSELRNSLSAHQRLHPGDSTLYETIEIFERGATEISYGKIPASVENLSPQIQSLLSRDHELAAALIKVVSRRTSDTLEDAIEFLTNSTMFPWKTAVINNDVQSCVEYIIAQVGVGDTELSYLYSNRDVKFLVSVIDALLASDSPFTRKVTRRFLDFNNRYVKSTKILEIIYDKFPEMTTEFVFAKATGPMDYFKSCLQVLERSNKIPNDVRLLINAVNDGYREVFDYYDVRLQDEEYFLPYSSREETELFHAAIFGGDPDIYLRLTKTILVNRFVNDDDVEYACLHLQDRYELTKVIVENYEPSVVSAIMIDTVINENWKLVEQFLTVGGYILPNQADNMTPEQLDDYIRLVKQPGAVWSGIPIVDDYVSQLLRSPILAVIEKKEKFKVIAEQMVEFLFRQLDENYPDISDGEIYGLALNILDTIKNLLGGANLDETDDPQYLKFLTIVKRFRQTLAEKIADNYPQIFGDDIRKLSLSIVEEILLRIEDELDVDSDADDYI